MPKIEHVGYIPNSSEERYIKPNADGSINVAGASTTGGGSYSSVLVGSQAGNYSFDASAGTITFSGLGTITLEQIGVITNLEDNVNIYNPQDDSLGGSISSNVLTLDYDTSSMSDTDTLQISLAYDNSEDYSLGAKKSLEINPDYVQQTDFLELVSEQDLTASYADFGDVIDTGNMDVIALDIAKDVNASTDVDVRIVGLTTSDSTTDIPLKPDSDFVTRLDFSGDGNEGLSADIGAWRYIKIQAKAGTVGATAGDLTIEYSLKKQ